MKSNKIYLGRTNMSKLSRKILSLTLAAVMLLGMVFTDFPVGMLTSQAATEDNGTLMKSLGMNENARPTGWSEETATERNPLGRKPGELTPLHVIAEPTIMTLLDDRIGVGSFGVNTSIGTSALGSPKSVVHTVPNTTNYFKDYIASRSREACFDAQAGKANVIVTYAVKRIATGYQFDLILTNAVKSEYAGPMIIRVGEVRDESNILKNGGHDGAFAADAKHLLNYLALAVGDYDGDGIDEVVLYYRGNNTIDGGTIVWYKLNSGMTWDQHLGLQMKGNAITLPKATIDAYGTGWSVNRPANKLFVSMDMGDLNNDGTDELVYTVNYMYDVGSSYPVCAGSDAWLVDFYETGGGYRSKTRINNYASQEQRGDGAYFTANLAGANSSYGISQKEKNNPSRHWIDNAGVTIADNDGDGKAELLIGGYTNLTSGTLTIGSTIHPNYEKQHTSGVIPVMAVYKFYQGSLSINPPTPYFMPDSIANNQDQRWTVYGLNSTLVGGAIFPTDIAAARHGTNGTASLIYMNGEIYAMDDDTETYYSVQNDWRNNSQSNVVTVEGLYVLPSLASYDTRSVDYVGNGKDDFFISYLGGKNLAYDKMGILAVTPYTNQLQGIISRTHYFFSAGSRPMSFAAPDIDNDTILLEFNKYQYAMSDPKVLAALAAPPFFKELAHLDGGEDYINSSETSYKTTDTVIGGETDSKALSVGAYVAFEKDFTIFTTLASFEAELEYKAKWTWEHETSRTTSISVAYQTKGGQDSVVLYSIPVDIYYCTAHMPDGSTVEYEQVFPYTPVTSVISLETYNNTQKRYKDILPDIGMDLFTHTPGIPSSYPSESTLKALRTDAWVHKTYVTSQGTSSVSQALEIAEQEISTKTFTNEISFKVGAGAGGLTIGVLGGYENSKGVTKGSAKSVAYEGKVSGIPKDAGSNYKYNWALAYFLYNSNTASDPKAASFPVVTYCVRDASSPPMLPSDLWVDAVTTNSVTLNWNESDTAAANIENYHLYRSTTGLPTQKIVSKKPTDAVNGVFTYTDTGSPAQGMIYEYYIVVEGVTEPKQSVAGPHVTAAIPEEGYQPVISLPSAMTVYAGQTDATLEVTFITDPKKASYTYQWFKYDTAKCKYMEVENATGKSIPIASPSDAGSYRVKVYYLYASGKGYSSIDSTACEVTYAYREPKVTLNLNSNVNENGYGVVWCGGTVADVHNAVRPTGTVKLVFTFTQNGKTWSGHVISNIKNDGSYLSGVGLLPAGAQCSLTAYYDGDSVFSSGKSDPVNFVIGVVDYALEITETKLMYGSDTGFNLKKDGVDVTYHATYQILKRAGNDYNPISPSDDLWFFALPGGGWLYARQTGDYCFAAIVDGEVVAQHYFTVAPAMRTLRDMPGGSYVCGTTPVSLSPYTIPTLGDDSSFDYILALVNSSGEIVGDSVTDDRWLVLAPDADLPAGTYMVCLQKDGVAYTGGVIYDTNYTYTFMLGTYTVTEATTTTDAEMPLILTHPQGASYALNGPANALTVEAEGDSLSYQWYSNESFSNSGGTPIPGAINASYTPPTNTMGTAFYYVVVTNTNNGATGEKTAAAASNAAAIDVNKQTYSLTASAGEGGTVSGTGTGYYEQGTAINVTATANSNYHFTGWTVNGATVTGGNTANPAIFDMPANAVTLTANFAPSPPPTKAQFTFNLTAKTYNGKAQGVSIAPKSGAGKITAVYYAGTGSTSYKKSKTKPTNAGSYAVTIDAAAGTGFRAVSGLSLGTFTINKANLSKVKVTIADTAWKGKQIKPAKFIYNGVRFTIKSHSTIKKYGKNKNIGKGTIQITGKSNFTGTKTITFKIVPPKNSISKITVAKKQMKVTWKQVSATQKITKYEVRYRVKGTSKWKTKSFAASASSAIIKSLTKGKKYEVQVRSCKKVSGARYYSIWSATKTSRKIK